MRSHSRSSAIRIIQLINPLENIDALSRGGNAGVAVVNEKGWGRRARACAFEEREKVSGAPKEDTRRSRRGSTEARRMVVAEDILGSLG